jgi:hypothetical protein
MVAVTSAICDVVVGVVFEVRCTICRSRLFVGGREGLSTVGGPLLIR